MSKLIVSEKGLKISEETPRGNCWLFHRWSRWQQIAEGKITTILATGDERITGNFFDQKRECLRCGKIQVLREKVEL